MGINQWRGRAVAAGALCVLLTAQAGAVNALDVAGLGAAAVGGAVQAMVTDGAIKDPFSADDAQPVGFNGMEKRVRQNNLTVLSLRRQAAGIGNTDVDSQFDEQEWSAQSSIANYQKQYESATATITALEGKLATETDPDVKAQLQKELAAAQASAIAAQSGLGVAQGTLASIDDAREAARRSLEDQQYTMLKQVENVENQMCVLAQTAYLGLVSLQDALETLDRNMDALDRNLEVMEKQVELGMASQLTLDNLEQSRRSLASQREALVVQQEQAQAQLAQLCGMEVGVRVRITGIPRVTAAQLSDMDYEADLEQAMDNSYTIWVKQDEKRQASNDYADGVTSTTDYFEAAKIALEAEERSVTTSVRQMYENVQEKQRLLEEAEAAYETEAKNFAVDELQYARGMISKLDYLTAQDDLAAMQDAVDTAELELFTAYNTYDWARRGYIGSTAGA